MNNDIAQGNWKEIKGEFKEKYGEITNSEEKEAEGKLEKLVGAIQEKYGKAKEEIEKEIKSW